MKRHTCTRVRLGLAIAFVAMACGGGTRMGPVAGGDDASAAGMGEGPYSFRVTDVLGQVLEDTGIAFAEGREVAGQAQFPRCTP